MQQTKKPIWATICSLVAIAILLKLGFWQIQRLEWKNALIASIEFEYDKPLEDAIINTDNIAAAYDEMAAGTVYRGMVTGALSTDALRFETGTPLNGVPSYNVWANFAIDGQLSVPIDLGLIPYTIKAQTEDALLPFNGQDFTFIVTMRKPQDGEKRLPYMLWAESHDQLAHIVEGQSKKPELRNKHKSYAIFWFTMAGVLALFYLLRFAKDWRKS